MLRRALPLLSSPVAGVTARPETGPGIFMRSNGYLRPGWFGLVTPTAFTPYEPLTGAIDGGVPAEDDRTAGILGILYAISRGNDAVVRDAGTGPFQGLVPAQRP